MRSHSGKSFTVEVRSRKKLLRSSEFNQESSAISRADSRLNSNSSEHNSPLMALTLESLVHHQCNLAKDAGQRTEADELEGIRKQSDVPEPSCATGRILPDLTAVEPAGEHLDRPAPQKSKSPVVGAVRGSPTGVKPKTRKVG